jgi:endogenous inhibitor of DNA gyrase (YacG/DUF329 family)
MLLAPNGSERFGRHGILLLERWQMPAPIPPHSGRKCPICAKPAIERFRPFCSKRCADIDLNRWLSGRYAIPADEEEGKASPSGIVEDEG